MTSGVYIRSDKTRRKMSSSHIGKKHTKETRMKMNLSHIGVKFTEKHKRKIGEANHGKQIIVHHKNGNHFDDTPENRQRMTRSKHMSLHRKNGDINTSVKYCELKKLKGDKK